MMEVRVYWNEIGLVRPKSVVRIDKGIVFCIEGQKLLGSLSRVVLRALEPSSEAGRYLPNRGKLELIVFI
jgi:hypothetical protein